MQTAYSYIRFSSMGQKEGVSTQRQKEYAAELAAKHNWRLDTTLKMVDEGRSAFRGKKQRGLTAFLEAVKDGRVKAGEVLIIERLDRLSRQKLDTACETIYSILRAGVKVATYSPERIYEPDDVNRIEKRLEIEIGFQTAHQESKNKSDRAYFNWNVKRKKAREQKRVFNTLVPGWLETTNEDGKIKIVPNRAKCAIVKRIFRMVIDGIGARTICKTLNAEGIPSFTAGRRKNARGTWSGTYLKLLINNPAVYGTYQPRILKDGRLVEADEPITGYYPPAIDEATYYLAQAAIKPRRNVGRPQTKVINLFNGLLYDARTKDKMQLQKSSPTERKRGCMRRISSWHHGIAPSWQYENFAGAFFSFVSELKSDRLLLSGETHDNTAALQAKVDDLRERIAFTSEAISTSSNYRALIAQVQRMEQEQAAAEAELKQAKANQRGTNLELHRRLISFVDALNSTKPSEREQVAYKARGAIADFVSQIWVLIGDARDKDGKKLRTLTAQVIFHDGTIRHFFIMRRHSVTQVIGSQTERNNAPRFDLRQYDGDNKKVWRALARDLREAEDVELMIEAVE